MQIDDLYPDLLVRHYDAIYAAIRDPSGDISFYRALAAELGGPALELGCGTGRTLLPIARAGIACTGVDSSAAMLEVLRGKSPPPNLTLVEGHIEAIDLGDLRFRLVTAPFRVLAHLLDVEAQLATLAGVRRHLLPGGVFAFDLFDPRLERVALLDEPEHLAATFREGSHQIRRFDTIHRDPTRQIMTARFRFEGGPPELAGAAQVQLRWCYRFELEHLLARAGFTDATFYGGFDRRPWTAGGETVVVARLG